MSSDRPAEKKRWRERSGDPEGERMYLASNSAEERNAGTRVILLLIWMNIELY